LILLLFDIVQYSIVMPAGAGMPVVKCWFYVKSIDISGVQMGQN